MQTMKLTNIKIKSATPRTKAYKLTDGMGVYLLVHPNGSKYWRMKYRYAGKEKLLSLGVYPEVSLKDARELRDAARKLLKEYIDPSEERRLKRLMCATGSGNTFSEVAWEWYEKMMSDMSPTHQDRTHRILEKDLIPFLGERAMSQVTPVEILAVLRKIEARGALETTRRAKGLVSQIYRYAVSTGRAKFDPAQYLADALVPTSTQHYAAVTMPAEASQLMGAIDGYIGTPTVRAALKLSPHLFVRPGELRHMEWSEIQWDKRYWEIPVSKIKTRKKMKHNHLVPLSKQSMAILQEQFKLTGGGRYVFPSARGRKRPMSENAIRVALRSMGYENHMMTAHGFRSMARTLLAEELNFRVDWIEHQLAHAVKDVNGEAYNRATFIRQRTNMMQTWSDYLDQLKSESGLAANEVPENNFTL